MYGRRGAPKFVNTVTICDAAGVVAPWDDPPRALQCYA